jgi:hypothetical protein
MCLSRSEVGSSHADYALLDDDVPSSGLVMSASGDGTVRATAPDPCAAEAEATRAPRDACRSLCSPHHAPDAGQCLAGLAVADASELRLERFPIVGHGCLARFDSQAFGIACYRRKAAV